MAKSCIYRINSKINPTKYYVGSAVDFLTRQHRHIYTLKKGIHKNILLQNHVNKYGIEDLLFSIIELVENKHNLISREQYFIDMLKPTFNICKLAGSSLGTKRSNKTKEILRNLRKQYTGEKHPLFGKPRTAETKEKLRLANLGKTVSEETKKN